KGLARRSFLFVASLLTAASIICYTPYQIGYLLITRGMPQDMVFVLMGPSQSTKGYYDYWDNGLFAVMVEYSADVVAQKEIHILPWSHTPSSLPPVARRSITSLFFPLVWTLLLCVFYGFHGRSFPRSNDREGPSGDASTGKTKDYGRILCVIILAYYA